MKAFLIVLLIILVIVVIAVVFPIITGRSGGGGLTGQTLFKSEDGGETWKNLEKFPGGEVKVLRLDTDDANFIFAGTARRGLWRGKQNGEEWQQFTQNLGEGAKVFDILEPASLKKLTALVFSNQRGRVIGAGEKEQKELLFTGLERFAFFKARASRDQKTIRVIGSDGGFYESVNSGRTWSRLAIFREGLVLFEVNRDNPAEIWTIDSRGSMARSQNGGKNWTDLSNGFRNFSGSEDARVLFYESKLGILYHASRYGLLESSDRGRTWQTIALPLAQEVLPITSFAPDPANPSRLFAGASNQFFVSSDRGASWHISKVPAAGAITAILIDPKNLRNIFIGLSAQERIR
ncbi:MAG: hypothetical protein Q8R12_02965 [bacterium]|nr:hypothetical protein [bacterium]